MQKSVKTLIVLTSTWLTFEMPAIFAALLILPSPHVAKLKRFMVVTVPTLEPTAFDVTASGLVCPMKIIPRSPTAPQLHKPIVKASAVANTIKCFFIFLVNFVNNFFEKNQSLMTESISTAKLLHLFETHGMLCVSIILQSVEK